MDPSKDRGDTPERASYEAPKLTVWGNVADLTKVGQTMPGDDMFEGSVVPGGP